MKLAEKATPFEEKLITFVETITYEQLQTVISSGIFTPLQIANLVAVIEHITQKQEGSTSSNITDTESDGIDPHGID